MKKNQGSPDGQAVHVGHAEDGRVRARGEPVQAEAMQGMVAIVYQDGRQRRIGVASKHNFYIEKSFKINWRKKNVIIIGQS